MRFPVYTIVQNAHDEILRLLIDPELFEGEFSREIFESLSQNSKSEMPFSIAKIRPTWIGELQDVDLTLNGKDPDRLNHLGAIRYIHIYKSLYESSQNVEWVINGAPPNILNPPGWDQVSTTNRILANLLQEEADKVANQFKSLLESRLPSSRNQASALGQLPGKTSRMKNHRSGKE
jgi:hypothetical protein